MAVNFLDFEQPIAELEAKIEELETLLGRGRIAVLYSPPPATTASSYG